MTKIIAFISQKGGVGKSTLARAFTREASNSGLAVKVADLDTQQGTFSDWHRQRLNNEHQAIASVEVFATAQESLKNLEPYDLLVVDGSPRASTGTLDIAKHSSLVILPSCASRDDLIPAIKLAYDLEKKGISRQKICIALTRVSTEAEIKDARDFIEQSNIKCLNGCLYEKPAYRQAQNEGLAITETRYKSLNEKADELMNSITNKLLND